MMEGQYKLDRVLDYLDVVYNVSEDERDRLRDAVPTSTVTSRATQTPNQETRSLRVGDTWMSITMYESGNAEISVISGHTRYPAADTGILSLVGKRIAEDYDLDFDGRAPRFEALLTGQPRTFEVADNLVAKVTTAQKEMDRAVKAAVDPLYKAAKSRE
ncbi:hypothetical protein ACFL0V_03105 [Nanoarchaeota archaeon]